MALGAAAAAVGAGPAAWRDGEHPFWVEAVARDLAAHRNIALVHAGSEQSRLFAALAHAINAALGATGATLRYIEPVAIDAGDSYENGELARDMHSGKVDTLVILTPIRSTTRLAIFGFAAAMARVTLSIQLRGAYLDETAQRVTFRFPGPAHARKLGDARAFDGTTAVLQPQEYGELVDGRTAAELIALIAGDGEVTARSCHRRHSRSRTSGDFDAAWTNWLRKGVITTPPLPRRPSECGPISPMPCRSRSRMPRHHAVCCGRTPLRAGARRTMAGCRSCPRPFNRLAWDNAAPARPSSAARLGLDSDDFAEIAVGGEKIRLPVMVLPGQAEGIARCYRWAMAAKRSARSVRKSAAMPIHCAHGTGWAGRRWPY